MMDQPIDLKKLLAQDPEFKQFAAEVMIAFMLSHKDTKGLIMSVYGFYQIGLSTEQVAQWIKTMNTFNEGGN